MNREVLSKYDVMTVGECPKVTTEQARLYTGESRKELSMVFQFEHMGLDKPKGCPKWELKRLQLHDLKQNLSKWQTELSEEGWNSLYWNNHDQPRIVSRFGNDGPFRKESAKMLATLLHMMQGTPYIYQGEEIGMTNARFESIDDYNDIESLNYYRETVLEKGGDPEEALRRIHAKGRDNGRTPMQWNSGPGAGFTTGRPWLKINPNYTEINVEEALADQDSIFYYYKKLIELRKAYPIITEGAYELILEDHPAIFAYVRRHEKETLLVINNFYEQETVFECPDGIAGPRAEMLIGNYNRQHIPDVSQLTLAPYESLVIRYQGN